MSISEASKRYCAQFYNSYTGKLCLTVAFLELIRKFLLTYNSLWQDEQNNITYKQSGNEESNNLYLSKIYLLNKKFMNCLLVRVWIQFLLLFFIIYSFLRIFFIYLSTLYCTMVLNIIKEQCKASFLSFTCFYLQIHLGVSPNFVLTYVLISPTVFSPFLFLSREEYIIFLVVAFSLQNSPSSTHWQILVSKRELACRIKGKNLN